MHAFFPHPKDHLIILRIAGKIDPVDRESIRELLDSRIREHRKIQVLIEIYDPEEADQGDTLKMEIINKGLHRGVERLAIVTDKSDDQFSKDLASAFPLAEIDYFTSAAREKALSWVQTGNSPNFHHRHEH
jgi:hypothetical protein